MPLAWMAAKIAPERTGGIASASHPCIKSAAWVRERDCLSNSCSSRAGHRGESAVWVEAGDNSGVASRGESVIRKMGLKPRPSRTALHWIGVRSEERFSRNAETDL